MLEYLVVFGYLSAQAGSEQTACRQIQDDAERLACYDSIFGPPAASAVAPDAAASPQQKVPAVEDFGLSEEQRNQRKKNPAPVVDMIDSHVAAIERLPRDRFTLTLENGQKWTQLEPTPMPRFHVGETVTIRKAAFNSFMARGPSAGTGVRVRRVVD